MNSSHRYKKFKQTYTRPMILFFLGVLFIAVSFLSPQLAPLVNAVSPEPVGKNLIPDDALRNGIVQQINEKYPNTGSLPVLPEGGLEESVVTASQLRTYSKGVTFDLRNLGIQKIDGLQTIRYAKSIDLSNVIRVSDRSNLEEYQAELDADNQDALLDTGVIDGPLNQIRDVSLLGKLGDPSALLEGNLWGSLDSGVALNFRNNPVQKFPELLAGYSIYDWGTTDFSDLDYSPFGITILDGPETITLHDLPYHFVTTTGDLIDLGQDLPVTLTDGKTDKLTGNIVDGTKTGARLEPGWSKDSAAVSGITTPGYVSWRVPCYSPWGVGTDGQRTKSSYTYKYEQQVSMEYTITVKPSVPKGGKPYAESVKNEIYPTFNSDGLFIPTEKDDLGVYIVPAMTGSFETSEEGSVQTSFGNQNTHPIIKTAPNDGWTTGTLTIKVRGNVVKDHVTLTEANRYFQEYGVTGPTEIIVDYNPSVSITNKTGAGGWVSASSATPDKPDTDKKPGYDPEKPDQEGVLYNSSQSVVWKPDTDKNFIALRDIQITVGDTTSLVRLQDQKAYLVLDDGSLGDILTVTDEDGNEHEVTYEGADVQKEQIILHFPAVTDIIHVGVEFEEKTLILHVRQVIRSSVFKPTLALPENGFLRLVSLPFEQSKRTASGGQIYNKVVFSGQEDVGYNDIILKPKLTDTGLKISPIVPMYYTLESICAGKSESSQKALSLADAIINCDNETEWWITVYLSPTTREPERFYSQEENTTDFGQIQLP